MNSCIIRMKRLKEVYCMDCEQGSFPDFTNADSKYYDILANDLKQSAGSPGKTCTVISFTSCYRGEGVSTVSKKLAMTLAGQTGRRTLFIDAGVQRSSGCFKTEPAPCPESGDAALHSIEPGGRIHATRFPNLFFLSVGSDAYDTACRIGGNGMASLIETLRNDFSFIIIDAPSLEQGDKAFLAGSASDGLVWVIESERVRWEVARRAKQKLLDANINIIGVVINRRKYHIPQWLYDTL